ncbi:MAG: bis(5'-nucleosyl)-tetraphosphatase (symmetrical) YqeK [Clostridia bacterium]|nr:bis(5'-nucleosyl)-tetraphosphatase (symmetrical) YqeK [Clostridia bacterium]
MTEKRFLHTVGVAEMAKRLGEIFLPDQKDELIAAGYLHDIAKEYTERELLSLINELGYELTSSDILSPAVLHAYAAPTVITRDFSEYASEDILSSVFNHTTGADQMSLFDEIIFISDFIEEGRPYEASKTVREELFSRLYMAKSYEEMLLALHMASLSSIESTVKSLEKRNLYINEKTKDARNYFLNLIKQETNNEH